MDSNIVFEEEFLEEDEDVYPGYPEHIDVPSEAEYQYQYADDDEVPLDPEPPRKGKVSQDELKRKRLVGKRPSLEQKDFLLCYLEEHLDLARGK